jgi:protein-L-isoaspartate O-methyltransferase
MKLFDRAVGIIGRTTLGARTREAARRAWMKYAMRGVRQADAHDRLDLAYKVSDPWHMETPRERYRFAQTNAVIREALGDRFERILEVGAGEGHQTEHLLELGGKVTTIEVSATAVDRARTRLAGKNVELVAGDLFAQPWANEKGKFDLVTACEVLYYMKDIPRFVRTMDALGGACVVTYFAPAAKICEAHVMAMPGAVKSTFTFEDTDWVAVCWKGAPSRS